MKEGRKYKNDVTIAHLKLACKQYHEMRKAKVTENFAIRQLELLSDVYSNIAVQKSRTVHHVSRVKLWSREAIKWAKKHPKKKAKNNLIVEHGTPRRDFARLVLRLYKARKLNTEEMEKTIKKYWKLAVVTTEEDLKLNKLKGKKFRSPEKRWAAAGIKLKEKPDSK